MRLATTFLATVLAFFSMNSTRISEPPADTTPSVPFVDDEPASHRYGSSDHSPGSGTESRPGGVRRSVASTAYCLHSNTATGRTPRDGDVAMNGVLFGTEVSVLSGPLAGRTFVVADRIGHSSELDFWICPRSAALEYGRRQIEIRLYSPA
jgi:hypothetical protein